MTELDYPRLFHEATGGCWHEWEIYTDWVESIPTCSYSVCKKCNTTLDCKEKENPTYSNPRDILNRMKEYCGEEKYREFIDIVGASVYDTYYIDEDYILNPPALLKKAWEFLKGEWK